MTADTSLDALRQEIDAIDDAIHDLIMRRTEVVEGVTELKRGDAVKIRPSREAKILYRLVGRHRGPFPRRELVRVWRELIVATLKFEGPFSVAVFGHPDEPGYWDLARDQYGSFTPMTVHDTARPIIEAVRAQEATVGILPLPETGEPEPWWPRLMSEDAATPRIIARLPFAGPDAGRARNREALAVCPVAVEPTGRDRTYVAFELADEVGRERVAETLEKAGFKTRFVARWTPEDVVGGVPYLVEVDGFLDSTAIASVAEAFPGGARHVLSLGGYSIPLTARELADPEEPVPEEPTP
jgi:chorismate mutase